MLYPFLNKQGQFVFDIDIILGIKKKKNNLKHSLRNAESWAEVDKVAQENSTPSHKLSIKLSTRIKYKILEREDNNHLDNGKFWVP